MTKIEDNAAYGKRPVYHGGSYPMDIVSKYPPQEGSVDLTLALAVVAAIHNLIMRPDGLEHLEAIRKYADGQIRRLRGERND